jgi:biopolymer transport protein ExbB
MKKLIALFTIFGILAVGASNMAYAQNTKKNDKKTVEQTEKAEATAATDTAVQAAAPETTSSIAVVTDEDKNASVEKSLHYVLKDKFAEGGPIWMAPVLICLILGLAFAIERIFYLNLADVNSRKLLDKVEKALAEGGIEKAKDACRDTKGPLAGVFYQGLERYDEGLDAVEKSLTSYGGVEMGKLERNLSWIGLFMALGPMLGFLGTVVGMVQAFDDIEKAGDISPTIVAGGMKVALITTVFGLITAIILQVFYNYLLSKIDGIVNDMENATIEFMDILVKNK